MPRNKRIDLQKVRAALDTICTNCQRTITPSEIRRIDFERMQCPSCGAIFVPSKLSSRIKTES